MKLLQNMSANQILDFYPGATLLYQIDDDNTIVYSNEPMWKLFACDSEQEFMEFCEGKYLNLIAQEYRVSIAEVIYQARRNNIIPPRALSKVCIADKNKKIIVAESTATVIHDETGAGFVLCQYKKLENAEPSVVETSDLLTGFLSRRQFNRYANEVIASYDFQNGIGLFVVYCNISNFKFYNVRYGNQSGNEALLYLASLIRKYGGDDITARLFNDHIASVANKDRQTIISNLNQVTEEFESQYGQYGMNLKVGVYEICSEKELIAFACDYAKIACDTIRKTTERICFYNGQLSRDVEISSHVIQNIDKAVSEKHIKVYYQPIVDCENGNIVDMEALARWNDPIYGFLSPADFIPVLENNRLISKLDIFVLREICREIKRAETEHIVTYPTSVNLSRFDFTECDIFAELEKAVTEFDIDRSMIHVEITESTIIEDPKILSREIEKFHNAGYQVWMDDFGSGYSSLNVLKDYPFDVIKLDMRFLSTLSESSKIIIKSVVHMANELHMETLAEGVETREQYEFLKSVGCNKLQGYYFSKPHPYEAYRKQNDVTKWK